MLVRDYMTRHPIMIEPEKSVVDAQGIMVNNDIRHLPVVGDGKKLLGMITRQRLTIDPSQLSSLNVWEITRYLSGLTVQKVMVKGDDLRTVSPDATLEEAADIMMKHKIGSLPVVEDGHIVVGILTEADLLDALKNLLGANDAGWRITVRVPDVRGEFHKLNSAIAENGWSVMALGSVRSPKTPDHWDIVLKVRYCTKETLENLIRRIEGQELIDIRETVVYDK